MVLKVDTETRIKQLHTYTSAPRNSETKTSMTVPGGTVLNTDRVELRESREKIINFDNTKNGIKLFDTIKKYSGAKTQRLCYRYVKRAVKEAGLANEGELEGGSAYMAADQLAKLKNFHEAKGLKREDFSVLPKGSVIVWDKGVEKHPHGHIEIVGQDGWGYSDFKRRLANDYGTPFRVFLPKDG